MSSRPSPSFHLKTKYSVIRRMDGKSPARRTRTKKALTRIVGKTNNMLIRFDKAVGKELLSASRQRDTSSLDPQDDHIYQHNTSTSSSSFSDETKGSEEPSITHENNTWSPSRSLNPLNQSVDRIQRHHAAAQEVTELEQQHEVDLTEISARHQQNVTRLLQRAKSEKEHLRIELEKTYKDRLNKMTKLHDKHLRKIALLHLQPLQNDEREKLFKDPPAPQR